MSEATWNAGQCTSWKRPLRALVLMAAMGLGGGPRALAQSLIEGERLTQDYGGEGGQDSARQRDCRDAFCIWSVSTSLGPCAGSRCFNDELYVTDRQGRILGGVSEIGHGGAPSFGLNTVEVRFTGPRQLELLNRTQPYADPEGGSYQDYRPERDTGVDQSSVSREVWNLSADGKTTTRARKAVREPAWKRQPPARPAAEAEPSEWSLQTPVSEELLARARPHCGEKARFALHHECHAATCVLVLNSNPQRPVPRDHIGEICTLRVKGSQMETLGEDLVPRLTRTAYVFTERDAPYGFPGSQQWISRTRPEYVVFVKTDGLHVEGSTPYPVRRAKSAEAARALAPTVHAYTRAHIPWGRGGWSGEKDLTLAWQLMRVGDSVRLHAEVDDEVLVPFTEGTGVNSDHLELTVLRASGSTQLGVLLAPEGQLQVRLWQRQDKGQKKQDLEEAFPEARGTWRPKAGGYEVDLELPLDALRDPANPLASGLTVLASDADEAHQQETLMGHTGTPRWWTEYPPSVEEYKRAR